MPLIRIPPALRRWLSPIGATVLAAAAFCVLGMAQILLLPRVTSVETDPPVPPALRQGMLYGRIGETTSVQVRFRVEQTPLVPAPRLLRMFSSGEADSLLLDGVPVLHGLVLPQLKSGVNIVDMRIRLTDPKPLFYAGIRGSVWNPVTMVILLLGAGVLLLWLRPFRKMQCFQDPWIRRIVCAGGVLRLLYAFATPFSINAYDFLDHVRYVQYLVEHWRLPESAVLWQGFQMPLYYLVLTPVFVLSELLGFRLHETAELLTVPSLVLSVLMLVFIASVVCRIGSTASRRLCVAVAAAFPGIAFFSAQVSNDVLVTAVGFVWVAAVLRAVVDAASRRWWVAAGALAGVGMLIKMNAAPWLPITLLVLACTPDAGSFRRRAATGFLAAAAAFAAGGWLYGYRLLVDPQFHLVANTSFPSLMGVLPTTAGTVLGFHPLRLLRVPFDIQSDTGAFSNVYFEDLVRTAHFGAFQLTPDAALLLVFWMAVSVIAAIGAWREIRSGRPALPLMAAGILLSAMLMRLRYPYVPVQHFRLAAVLFLPALLLLQQGIAVAHRRTASALVHVIVGVYALVCAAVVTAVSVVP